MIITSDYRIGIVVTYLMKGDKRYAITFTAGGQEFRTSWYDSERFARSILDQHRDAFVAYARNKLATRHKVNRIVLICETFASANHANRVAEKFKFKLTLDREPEFKPEAAGETVSEPKILPVIRERRPWRQRYVPETIRDIRRNRWLAADKIVGKQPFLRNSQYVAAFYTVFRSINLRHL